MLRWLFLVGVGAVVFYPDVEFTQHEREVIQMAMTMWNQYISHPDCKFQLSSNPKFVRGEKPPFDKIFTIQGGLHSELDRTYTVIRTKWVENERSVEDLDIHVNLLYTRQCPDALLIFMLHELGHALGLIHNDHPLSIMNISYDPYTCLTAASTYLSTIDIYLYYHHWSGLCLVKPIKSPYPG